ncbi:MAG: hypothetical protein J5630_00880 [Bacteroidaceae bacterium]|nr:hypothetical protein [Bacteroidaceae bacterium]
MSKKIKQLPGPKVSAETEYRVNALAHKAGLDSVYKLLCYCVNSLIQYMDEDNQLDPELQKAIDIFEKFEGWGQVCSLTDIGQQWKVAEAVYFVQDENKVGSMACWARKPFFMDMKVTFNKKNILDMMIHRMFPEMDKKLTLLAMQSGTGSHYETIQSALHQLVEDPDEQTFRDMFRDCARSQFGRDTGLQKYIRHNWHTMGAIEKTVRQTTIFDFIPNEQGQELSSPGE